MGLNESNVPMLLLVIILLAGEKWSGLGRGVDWNGLKGSGFTGLFPKLPKELGGVVDKKENGLEGRTGRFGLEGWIGLFGLNGRTGLLGRVGLDGLAGPVLFLPGNA